MAKPILNKDLMTRARIVVGGAIMALMTAASHYVINPLVERVTDAPQTQLNVEEAEAARAATKAANNDDYAKAGVSPKDQDFFDYKDGKVVRITKEEYEKKTAAQSGAPLSPDQQRLKQDSERSYEAAKYDPFIKKQNDLAMGGFLTMAIGAMAFVKGRKSGNGLTSFFYGTKKGVAELNKSTEKTILQKHELKSLPGFWTRAGRATGVLPQPDAKQLAKEELARKEISDGQVPPRMFPGFGAQPETEAKPDGKPTGFINGTIGKIKALFGQEGVKEVALPNQDLTQTRAQINAGKEQKRAARAGKPAQDFNPAAAAPQAAPAQTNAQPAATQKPAPQQAAGPR